MNSDVRCIRIRDSLPHYTLSESEEDEIERQDEDDDDEEEVSRDLTPQDLDLESDEEYAYREPTPELVISPATLVVAGSKRKDRVTMDNLVKEKRVKNVVDSFEPGSPEKVAGEALLGVMKRNRSGVKKKKKL